MMSQKPTYEELEQRNQGLEKAALERIRAEQQLHANEEYLSSIFRSAPVGIGLVVNRELKKANSRLCMITGYDEGDLVGRSSRILYLNDEDFEFVGREKRAQIKDHGTGTVETHWRRKDGKIIDVLLSSTPIDLQDHSKGITFAALDITERKKSEIGLLESERKWRNILAHVPQIGIALDPEARIVFANEYFLKLTGWKKQDVVEHNWFDLFIPEHVREDVRNMFHTVMGQKDTIGFSRYENEIMDRSGNLINVAWSNVLTMDADGNILDVTCLGVDLTERKRAETSLRESEEKFRVIFEQAAMGMALVSPNGKWLQVNQRLCDIVGYTKTELLNMTFQDITHPDDLETDMNYLEQMLNGEIENYSIKKRYVHKKGHFIWVHLTVSLVRDEESQPKHIVSVVEEITEQVKLEAQLLQAQKMESVGRLAGGVAHDYNNALSVIIGFTELAMEAVKSNEPLHEDLNEVMKAAKRATEITRQLLAFARQETIAPVVLDLNEKVESTIKMLRHFIGEDIDLAWLPGTELKSIEMDPSQLDQILANLCVNARDAIAGVGKITIETGMVTIDTAYCADHAGFIPGEFVMLAVSDDGCGMDKEIIGNIYEPFFTTKSQDKGTGLGLPMVYGIVKQNKGFINVYSEPNFGTTFRIYLPCSTGEVAIIPENNREKNLQGRGETILIVEDDVSINKLAGQILFGLGYTVLTARAPDEAIVLANEHQGDIHLLLTDVIMPGMNGLDLANKLQSIYPKLRRIFMSGYTSNAISHHGVLDKGVHFVQKPFSKVALATIVRKVLDENTGTEV